MRKDRKLINEARLRFKGISLNESFARICVSGFVIGTAGSMGISVTAEELADIKTAVSEAVTNCIVHGYKEMQGDVSLLLRFFSDGELYIQISDMGCGIEDVEKARMPLYTTDPDSDRCGMGFSIMESFMTKLKVSSKPGKGTRVTMVKQLFGRR
ncbi:MAG: anti-sigma F factor [Ruminococcaceae bacterium]|nr:anti-sigma F factor [Oscillospiraceae bacterium]